MSEIKKTDDEGKKVETRGVERLTGRVQGNQEVQIVGGSDVPRTGKPIVIDKNSPAEAPQAEVHIHADRRSYKDALENDQ